MVEEAVKSYRVAYERDESGWWVATVRGVRGCHTQGRTVDEARRRIPDHWHAHARPSDGFFDPTSDLYGRFG